MEAEWPWHCIFKGFLSLVVHRDAVEVEGEAQEHALCLGCIGHDDFECGGVPWLLFIFYILKKKQ